MKIREKQKFGDRIIPGGDMYENHTEFLEWAEKYDTAGTDMRSRARHDEWQKLIACKLLVLDGTADLEKNAEQVLKVLRSTDPEYGD